MRAVDEQGKPPERIQFSLRTLLLTVTAICVVIGLLAQVGDFAFPVIVLFTGTLTLAAGWFSRNPSMTQWGYATSIGGLLLCCVWPNMLVNRMPARRSAGANNLKQIAIALHNYHDVHKSLPARYRSLSDGSAGLSWRVGVLPYLESSTTYSQFHFEYPWDSPHNLPLAHQRPESYACPSAKKRLKTESDYYAIGGPDSCLPDAQAITLAYIKDGTSNTIMVVESHTFHAVWSEPRDLDPTTMNWNIIQAAGISSGHNGGAQMGMADGSVRFQSNDIDPEVVKQLANRHDGQPGPGWDN